MKFLVDARLPRRLATRPNEAGYDALHTRDLPGGNSTTDAEILRVAAAEDRVVVTKDADFVNYFHLKGEPEKLLLISTGNISNADLEALFLPNLPAIVRAFQSSSLVELTRTALIIHS
jgi:predicted nuclease of predicted toxin-antitoxin system